MDEPYSDIHLSLLKAWLALQAFIGVSFALISPLSGVMAGMNDPEFQEMGPVVTGVVFGLMGILCFGVFGALSGAGAVGLWKGRTWGWYCACISLMFYMLGCMMPLAIYGLWALARPEVRKSYGIG